jgi:hypothetical protein
MNYDITDIAKPYDIAMAMPKSTMEFWLNALSKFIKRVSSGAVFLIRESG